VIPTAGDTVLAVLADAKRLAQRYRALTGRPLGVTGEIAEFEAAQILGLHLAPVRTAGYDATEHPHGSIRKLQIKGRCVLPDSRPGQRVGRIDASKEWDAVLLVLLDQHLDAFAIYEASRSAVEAALAKPGSRSRNERGALGVNAFKGIAKCRWTRNAA
jgi:hypothetical protein